MVSKETGQCFISVKHSSAFYEKNIYTVLSAMQAQKGLTP
jgi:hypothetical protein